MHIIYAYNNEIRAKEKSSEILSIFDHCNIAVEHLKSLPRNEMKIKEFTEMFPLVSRIHGIYGWPHSKVDRFDILEYCPDSYDFVISDGKYVLIYLEESTYENVDAFEKIKEATSANHMGYLCHESMNQGSDDFYHNILKSLHIYDTHKKEKDIYEERLESMRKEIKELKDQVKTLQEKEFRNMAQDFWIKQI